MSKLKAAMERARDGRAGPEAVAPPPTEPEPPLDAGDVVEATEGLDPVYQQTRVESVDPLGLVRNKILSFLHAGLVSNQVKILRTQVLSQLAEIGGNSVLITSAGPGEGKTFTAMNLAVSIAQELDRTALLVDADIRKPSVHAHFGLGSPPGLSDYLLGLGEIPELLVNPGIPRLTILPAGNRLANSSELLGSPRMASLVAELKARYADRVLVFDSPSLLTQADALVFSKYTDGVLLVVEAERAPKRDVGRALEFLADRRVLGIVYNKSRDLR